MKKLSLSDLFDLFIEAHFELLITGYITLELSNIHIAIATGPREVFMFCFGVAGLLISCVLAPIIFMYVFNKSNNDLRSHKFKKHFHPFYGEVKFTDPFARLYIFYFMLRRILFLVIIVYVKIPAI